MARAVKDLPKGFRRYLDNVAIAYYGVVNSNVGNKKETFLRLRENPIANDAPADLELDITTYKGEGQ